MNDTQRLDWYVAHCATMGDPLGMRIKPDKTMKITAYGELTEHVLWHWPMDRQNREYQDFREAIDERIKESK